MRRILQPAFVAFVLMALATISVARPITIDDFSKIVDVDQPVLSPDGKRIAYTAGEQIFVVPVAGDSARALTLSTSAASNPVWSLDGRALYFLSDRSGSSQLWKLPMDVAGGLARRLTPVPPTHAASCGSGRA
jgi:Tol biopolymer transport system component